MRRSSSLQAGEFPSLIGSSITFILCTIPNATPPVSIPYRKFNNDLRLSGGADRHRRFPSLIGSSITGINMRTISFPAQKFPSLIGSSITRLI